MNGKISFDIKSLLDTAQEPVPVLAPQELGKVQQQVPPARQAQQVQHPVSHLQGIMILAVLLQVLHQLLVGSTGQRLLQSGQVGLGCLLPFVLR